MRVDCRTVLPAAELDAVWALYQRAFGPLADQAASRHVLNRNQFAAEMADATVVKLLVRQGEQPVSLMTLTAAMDGVSWVSAEYYRSRYPVEAANGTLLYITNMLTDPAYAGPEAFLLVTSALNDLVPVGAVGFDICAANVQRGFPTALHRRLLALRGGASAFDELDTQTFYALRVW